jgi:DNA-binding transcriptional MocR family regulator
MSDMDLQPLYQRVAHHYRGAIRSGVLTPGARMPSVRSLTRLHQVSLSTALQACRSLEDEGLLEARPRSGYFVRMPRRAAIPPANEPDTVQALDAAQYVGVHDRVSAFVAQSERHVVKTDFAAA